MSDFILGLIAGGAIAIVLFVGTLFVIMLTRH
jgi:hypothetical protein